MANVLNQNKIIFLGTGGGGSMTGLQTLATAGTWLKLGEVNFYIDPGPGAVWHLRHFSKEKLNPTLLDAAFISHRHQDHCEALGSLIEAMVYQPIITCFPLNNTA